MSPQLRPRRLPRIALLLLAFVGLGSAYALLNPLLEASDELWHYPMVKRLADGDGLAVQDPADVGLWRQQGSQPPLYYALMALATNWINTDDLAEVRWINPHADIGRVTQDGNLNLIIHTAREAEWPGRGTVLAIRLIRLLSVLMGTGTVYFTYRLALELRPDQPALALASAGLAAFTPMFLFISASVNNDNLVILLSTVSLWALVRWLRQPQPPSVRACLGLGLLLGSAALSKVSALGLWPLTALVLAYRHLEPSRATSAAGWRDLLGALLLVFGPALALCFWWFWRNLQLYGDWLGWNAFIAIAGPRAQPASLLQLWGERSSFIHAYWGLFGGVNVPLPAWCYLGLNALVLLAALGWLRRALPAPEAGRSGRPCPRISTVHLPWAVLLLWLGALLFGLWRWTRLTPASQGRLLFPGLAVISTLLGFGLAGWWRRLPVVAAAGLALLAAAVPVAVLAPAYAAPRDLTPAEVIAFRAPAASFGGEMELLGYSLEADSVQPGQAVHLTLYWRGLIAMDRNWSVFIHLVDEAGVLIAQRDRYPGQGRLATTQLRPGQAFADHYVIELPPASYAPTMAQVELGLYDVSTGERLPLDAGGDVFRLGRVAVQARPGDIPNPIQQNLGNQLRLQGYRIDRRVLQPGQAVEIILYWQALARMPVNYSVSVRVRDDQNTRWAARDAWPQDGAAPTRLWQPGQTLEDAFRLTLDPTTPPGQYQVELIVYDALTGTRLQLVTPDGLITDADTVQLSGIRVAP